MDSAFIIEKSVVIVTVFAITMIMAMYSTWAERKVAAFFTRPCRTKPRRLGWFITAFGRWYEIICQRRIRTEYTK